MLAVLADDVICPVQCSMFFCVSALLALCAVCSVVLNAAWYAA
jgi:hypothetical protein